MSDQLDDQIDDLNDPGYRQFVQSVIDNIKKNGFPGKKVAFGLEKLYEAAEKKSINLNRVLDTLDSIQIAHQKTPDKIIFFPKPEIPVVNADEPQPAGVDPSMLAGIDPSMFAGLDPSMFEGLDFTNIKNMSLPQMIGMVGKMMKNMTPEQMQSIKSMYDHMSDEQKSSLMDKAKDFMPFYKDKGFDDDEK
ncbi:MAG: hypothetical protein JXX14_20140 [Deltaproteobacteria bacterium]|nr:hypothetical protein [Deltaproteobacteria bacterium]